MIPPNSNKTSEVRSHKFLQSSNKSLRWVLLILVLAIAMNFGRAHIVLTRDDRGQSLVLTGEDGKGGKGSKGGGGDQLVIAGHNMGGSGQSSNMVMQDASNRDGDVVINGNSMIVPGEDGHIVLADGRDRDGGGGGNFQGPPPNLFAFWMPYLRGRMDYRMMQMFSGGGMFG